MSRFYAWRLRKTFLTWFFRKTIRNFHSNYSQQRNGYPMHRVQNVYIYGNSAFTADVTEALAQLQSAYPYGYMLVQRYIYAIEQKDSDWQKSAMFGVRYERVTAEGRLPISTTRYAAFLVRIAVGRRRALSWHLPKSPRAEAIALGKEQHAMELLLRARGF
jgi:hypothetical protein